MRGGLAEKIQQDDAVVRAYIAAVTREGGILETARIVNANPDLAGRFARALREESLKAQAAEI